MMRSILGMLVLVLVLAPAGVAGEEKAKRGAPIAPEQVARIILGGQSAQQVFIAHYLQQVGATELLKIQQAICTLAPEVVDEVRARPKIPPIGATPDGPLALVNIEVRVLEADVTEAEAGSSFLRDLGLPQDPHARMQLLDDAQIEVILRAVEKSQQVRQITAPRITAYDRQRAEVSILEQISYVEDYDVEVANGAFIADPIIGVTLEGLVLAVTPTMSEDRKYISLDLVAMQAEVRKPIPERIVDGRGAVAGQKVTIQVPQTDLSYVQVAAKLPSGGSMLVRVGAWRGKAKNGVDRYLLVRATVVQIDGAALKQDLENVEKALKAEPGKRAGNAPGK